MKKRLLIVFVLLVISIVAFKYFIDHRIPDDVENKSWGDKVTLIVSLATAIVSLITSVVTLITTIRQKGA